MKVKSLSPQSPTFSVASGERVDFRDVPLLNGIPLTALQYRPNEQGAAGASSQVVVTDGSQPRQLTEASQRADVLPLYHHQSGRAFSSKCISTGERTTFPSLKGKGTLTQHRLRVWDSVRCFICTAEQRFQLLICASLLVPWAG